MKLKSIYDLNEFITTEELDKDVDRILFYWNIKEKAREIVQFIKKWINICQDKRLLI